MSYIPPQTITGLIITGKMKTTDTSRTNTATVTDDPDLIVVLKPNTRYLVTADLIYTTSLLAGFKMQWGVPSGATTQYINVGQNDGLVKNLTDIIGLSVTTTNPNYLFLRGIVRTSATAGNLSIKWAQNAASAASSAVFKADSSVTAIELV